MSRAFLYSNFAVSKVSVKVNSGISLKFFVSANLESMSCEVSFPEKKNSEKLILKPLKSLFFVSRHNLRAKNN